ncbi:hypothetical protein B0H14DRAFT_3452503 [Mycena olivaceomarginata]|nr:hypothetical protein B0H14DRAFT_3452503 [Mycena olivaceomarginata]
MVFTHLLNDIKLEDMVTAVCAAQLTTRSTTEFKVELKDLAAITKGKGNIDGKKDGKKKKHLSPIISTGKPGADTNLLQKRAELDSEESEGDGEGDEVDGKKVKSKTKSLPQLVAQLEADNACLEHDGHGCIKCTKGHVQLSKQDLLMWAIFLKSGYTSTTTPPLKLKVGSGQPKPVPAPQPLSMLAVTSMASMSPYGYPPAPWWPPYQTLPAPQALNHYGDGPSSPPQEIKDIRLFPCLESWLQSLDDGPQDADDHNFSQYAPDFQRKKYVRVVDLEMLQVNDLKCLIPELPHGTATRILVYAMADITWIRKVKKKHLRVEAWNGARYA